MKTKGALWRDNIASYLLHRKESGIIHILAVEGHNIIEHTLGLNSGAVWVEFDGLNIAVYGFMPFRLFPKGVTLFVPLLCSHLLLLQRTTGLKDFIIYSTLSYLLPMYSSSANRWSSALLHQELE